MDSILDLNQTDDTFFRTNMKWSNIFKFEHDKQKIMSKIPKQQTGNTGLYYVSYLLAKQGWNVLPTSRNSKGPDLIIYSTNGKKIYKIQVKSLSKWDNVSIGGKENFKMSDIVIICTDVYDESPQIYIARTKDIKINKYGWIGKKDYLNFKDNWGLLLQK